MDDLNFEFDRYCGDDQYFNSNGIMNEVPLEFILMNFQSMMVEFFDPSCLETDPEFEFLMEFASKYTSVHRDLIFALICTIEDQLC